MNFFVDFEATQFSNGIISVGCVAETGEELYTTVYTRHKVTPFITELTGITPEQVKSSHIPEDVFSYMFDWVDQICCGESPHFYCYGNCDKDFVKNNFRENTNFKASAMLGYLYTDMHDYAEDVKAHFGLCQHIALKKVYDYYTGNKTIQRHNALEDAKMLKVVFENVTNNSHEFDAFPEYQAKEFNKKIEESFSNFNDDCRVERYKNGKMLQSYPSFGAAVKWAYEQIPAGEERAKASLATIAKNIRKASKDKRKKYYNCTWILIENHEREEV